MRIKEFVWKFLGGKAKIKQGVFGWAKIEWSKNLREAKFEKIKVDSCDHKEIRPMVFISYIIHDFFYR